MLPGPLAPLDPHKTRALTTIYAPRKLKTRKYKTAQSRMLEKDVAVKPTLSPFHPLPAIGQKIERSKTKVIIFDLNKNDALDGSVKLHDVLSPLTPLRIHGLTRKNTLDQLEIRKPQQLLRENTYDVLEPLYVNAGHDKKTDTLKKIGVPKVVATDNEMKDQSPRPKVSPKTRFKNAALQVTKLSSTPEMGKLLCLRERQTFTIRRNEEDKSVCKLQELQQSPAQNINKLSKIFQTLEMKGQNRDKLKKENSWF